LQKQGGFLLVQTVDFLQKSILKQECYYGKRKTVGYGLGTVVQLMGATPLQPSFAIKLSTEEK